jgi:hypothetical protein
METSHAHTIVVVVVGEISSNQFQRGAACEPYSMNSSFHHLTSVKTYHQHHHCFDCAWL